MSLTTLNLYTSGTEKILTNGKRCSSRFLTLLHMKQDFRKFRFLYALIFTQLKAAVKLRNNVDLIH